jgi:hypothetical protein
VGADTHSRRRLLTSSAVGVLCVVAIGIAAGRVAVVGAQGQSESPYQGRLAKAVFLSDRVGEAIGDAAAKGPAAAREALVAAAARAKQPEPALATPAGATPVIASRLARRRGLAQGMVALVATPEARAESIPASEALISAAPAVEDAQGIGIPLTNAEAAEAYLKAHRESALTPYLYAYLMVQYRLAFERQVAAKALDGQKASAKKYRTFRLRALASTDPLVKAVAEDIDGQLFLERATPEHPRNFDPDACCRDKI